MSGTSTDLRAGSAISTQAGEQGAHASGPWTIEPEPSQWFYILSGGVTVADIKNTGTATSKANARLISAAPDLLASLLEVRSWRMQSEDMMPPEIRGAWLRAEAAIAKATGASS